MFHGLRKLHGQISTSVNRPYHTGDFADAVTNDRKPAKRTGVSRRSHEGWAYHEVTAKRTPCFLPNTERVP
jgi:hypothetical protein